MASFIDLEILVIMKNEAYFVRRLITLFVIPFIETDIAQDLAVRRCSLMQVIDVDYRFEKKTLSCFSSAWFANSTRSRKQTACSFTQNTTLSEIDGLSLFPRFLLRRTLA